MDNNQIVFSKEFAYFLGFLWSDGFIERKRTILEILEDDAQQIVEDIKRIDFLNICTMKRTRKNRKPQMSIYFCNTSFYDNFQSKHFIDKSQSSPISLIEIIPENLIRYFYLGLIDGDGCFYLHKTMRQFYITSSYNQDWNHVVNLFKKLNINQYEIRQIQNKNGNKSSYIRVKKYEEIKNLFNYLYPNGYDIGLKRKFLKCKEIVDSPPKYSSNKSKISKDDLIGKINSGKNIYEISIEMKCSWRKIHNFCKEYDIKKPRFFYKEN